MTASNYRGCVFWANFSGIKNKKEEEEEEGEGKKGSTKNRGCNTKLRRRTLNPERWPDGNMTVPLKLNMIIIIAERNGKWEMGNGFMDSRMIAVKLQSKNIFIHYYISLSI